MQEFLIENRLRHSMILNRAEIIFLLLNLDTLRHCTIIVRLLQYIYSLTRVLIDTACHFRAIESTPTAEPELSSLRCNDIRAVARPRQSQ